MSPAQDRVDWAKRMLDKGYLSKQAYESELLRHYEALTGLLKARGVSPELLDDYANLKARLQAKSPSESSAKPDAGGRPQPELPAGRFHPGPEPEQPKANQRQ